MGFSQKEYDRLIQEIFTRFPSVQNVPFDQGYKPGLENMYAFAEALGNPQNKFRSIHVAGTNGKGSVSNMLASALSATGLKTGLYTSPHIVDFRERMRIAEVGSNAYLPTKEYVYDFLSSWEPYFLEKGLSFFEITTGLAFKWFADSEVDVAVVEVGLGGRLDSTNIIVPELGIITSIGLDHCHLLGSTLAEIAAEKAGIIKKCVPILIAEDNPETTPVFEEKAWMSSPIYYAEKIRPSLWNERNEIIKGMDLKGAYQQKNLRTVLVAIDLLSEIPGFKCLDDSETVILAIRKTASRMGFTGRWQTLSNYPKVICDIGHNAPALKYNFEQLQSILSSGENSCLIIVYGIMADKDFESILPIMPKNAIWFFAAPDTPRALAADEIQSRYVEYCNSLEIKPKSYSCASVKEAVRSALLLANNLMQTPSLTDNSEHSMPLIYIGGSTFVVAEAVKMF